MYLKERIIGILVYLIVNIIFCVALRKTKKNTKIILFAYAAALSLLAFIYIPHTTADLSRYISEMNTYKSMDLSTFMTTIGQSKIISSKIILYTISKTGIDGLLPMLVALIYYGLFFRILYIVKEKYDIDNRYLVMSIIFFMATGIFATTINAFRNYLGIMLIAYCYLQETINKKKIYSHIPIYLFASFMHPAVLFLSIIRLTIGLTNKESTFYKQVIKTITIISVLTIGAIYYSDLVQLIVEKAESYIKENKYSYIWELIIYIIVYIFIVITLLTHRKQRREITEIDKCANNLTLYLLLLLLFPEYSIFTRFSSFAMIIFAPILMVLLNLDDKEGRKMKYYYFIYLVTISVILTISITRGNLCSYKFFIQG